MDGLNHVFDDISAWLVEELEKMQNQRDTSWIKPWTEAKVVIGGTLHTVGALPSNIRTPRKYYSPLNHLFLLTQMNRRNSRYKTNLWITPRAIEQLDISADSLNGNPYRIVMCKLREGRYNFDQYAHLFKDMYHIEQIENGEDKLGYKINNTEIPRQIKYKKCESFLNALQENCGLIIEKGPIYGQNRASYHIHHDVVRMRNLEHSSVNKIQMKAKRIIGLRCGMNAFIGAGIDVDCIENISANSETESMHTRN